LVFQYFHFKSIWWRLFQKYFVCTLVNIYVFILTVISVTSHLRLSIWPLYPANPNFILFSSHRYLLFRLICISFPSHIYLLSISPLYFPPPLYFLSTSLFPPIFYPSPLFSSHFPFNISPSPLYLISTSYCTLITFTSYLCYSCDNV
jgi:hypothetical protein